MSFTEHLKVESCMKLFKYLRMKRRMLRKDFSENFPAISLAELVLLGYLRWFQRHSLIIRLIRRENRCIVLSMPSVEYMSTHLTALENEKVARIGGRPKRDVSEAFLNLCCWFCGYFFLSGKYFYMFLTFSCHSSCSIERLHFLPYIHGMEMIFCSLA